MILPPTQAKWVIMNPGRKYVVSQETPIVNVFASGGYESKGMCGSVARHTFCSG